MAKYGEGYLGLSPQVIPSVYYDMSGGNLTSTTWSFSCWVYGSDAANTTGPVFRMLYANGGGVQIRNYKNTPKWILDTIAPWSAGYDGGDYTQQGWHHIGWTMDGSDGVNVVSNLYVDGTLLVTRSIAYNMTGTTPDKLWFGTTAAAPGNSLFFRWLTIWDDATLDATDFAAITALGVDGWQWPDRGMPEISANITFIASFMNGPNADFAVGDTTIYDGGTGALDGWAWVSLGPDENSCVIDLIGGMPAHNGAPDDAIPLWCALAWRARAAERPQTLYSANGYNDIISVSDATYLHGVYLDNILYRFTDTDVTNDPTSSWANVQTHVLPGAQWIYDSEEALWTKTATVEAVAGATARGFCNLGAAYYKPKRLIEADTDEGTDATQVVISEAANYSDGYLTGAYVAVIYPSVACHGQIQKITSHIGNTLTLGGTFSASPGVGTRVVVYDGAYIIPNPFVQDEPMGVCPENVASGQRREVGISSVYNSHNRGYMRTTGTDWRLSTVTFSPAYELGFGVSSRADGEAGQDLWQIGFRRIQLFTGNRQLTRLDELYDNFNCNAATYQASPSRRIYRWQNITRNWNNPNRAGSQLGYFLAANTWRHARPWIQCVEWDETNQYFKGLLRAQDVDGNVSYGYVNITWDVDTTTWTVVDDENVTNPIITQVELNNWFKATPMNTWVNTGTCLLRSAHQSASGDWWFTLFVHPVGEDYNDSAFMHGSPPWGSLNEIDLNTAVLHEPLRSGGESMVNPLGHAGMWEDISNRDVEWFVGRNQFAPPGSGRSWYLTGRGQQHLNNGGEIWEDAQRRLVSIETDNGHAYAGYPLQSAYLAPADHVIQFHYPNPICFSDKMRAVATDLSFQPNVYLISTDCGWYRSWSTIIVAVGSAPEEADNYATVFHGINDEHHLVMYCTGFYNNTNNADWGTIWWEKGKEAEVVISDGEIEGWFCTPILLKPKNGWENLHINAVINAGIITVAIMDPENMEIVITGYNHTDCDVIAGGERDEIITWGGQVISELDAYDHLRLEFKMTRSLVGDTSPIIYEWYCTDAQRTYDVVISSSDEIIIADSEIMQQSQYDFMVTNI